MSCQNCDKSLLTFNIYRYFDSSEYRKEEDDHFDLLLYLPNDSDFYKKVGGIFLDGSTDILVGTVILVLGQNVVNL